MNNIKKEQQKYTKKDIPNLKAIAKTCKEKKEYYLQKYKELMNLIAELENESEKNRKWQKLHKNKKTKLSDFLI